jgi:hypothetical protein
MRKVDVHRNRSFLLQTHAAGALLCGLLLLAGCGRGYRAVDMRGTVSVDGVPANAGHITFSPAAAGMGRGGMAIIASDGSYVLRDVPLGDVTFTVVPEKSTGRQVATSLPAGGTGMIDEVRPMLDGMASFGRGQVTMQLQVTPELAHHDFVFQATGTVNAPPR